MDGRRVTADDLVAQLGRAPVPALVGIDGLPCSGKTTLAQCIQKAHGFACVSLDEFVRPERAWPSHGEPTYPFEYIRYDEFLHAVAALASFGECVYLPFDWQTFTISSRPRTVRRDRTVIVEGVSTLNAQLRDLYGLKVFVESDRSSTLEAALSRGIGGWAAAWRDLFLPSVDLYMTTHTPERYADLIVPGRGKSAPA